LCEHRHQKNACDTGPSTTHRSVSSGTDRGDDGRDRPSMIPQADETRSRKLLRKRKHHENTKVRKHERGIAMAGNRSTSGRSANGMICAAVNGSRKFEGSRPQVRMRHRSTLPFVFSYFRAFVIESDGARRELATAHGVCLLRPITFGSFAMGTENV
jgi:hypothetical protein